MLHPLSEESLVSYPKKMVDDDLIVYDAPTKSRQSIVSNTGEYVPAGVSSITATHDSVQSS